MTDRTWALLVLMPDAMTAGRWDELWSALSVYDVDLVATTPLLMSPDELAELYAQHARNGGRSPHGVWVSHTLAALDMSVALLLRSRRKDLDLSAALREAKGPSRFGTRKPDALREIWPFAEKCQSLLHTSDDVEAVPREASLFFGRAVVTAALGGATLPPVDPGDVPALRGYVPAATEPHPYDIVLRTVSRGLMALATDAALTPDVRWREARDRVEALRDDLREEPHATLRETFRATFPETLRAAPRSATAAFPVAEGLDGYAGRRHLRARLDLAELLPLLTTPAGYEARLARHALEVLTANGLWLERDERHRLTVAVTFFHEDSARDHVELPAAAWSH